MPMFVNHQKKKIIIERKRKEKKKVLCIGLDNLIENLHQFSTN